MLLFPEHLKLRLPPLHVQEAEVDPLIYFRFYLPGTNRAWYVMEGQDDGDDFRFFGFIAGDACKFGSFALSELEQLRSPTGATVARDEEFQQGRLTNVVPAPDL